MVQDLLDLSRTEDPRATVRHDRLDLQQVCEMVMGMYSGPATNKHVQLLAEISPEARSLRGDERLLMLSLKNLIDNAVKFTNHGSVTVRSYLRDATPAANNGAEPAPTSNIVLEVVDTGCGIPREDQERVFERFYTVNRSRGGADRGTGLGLAIVKHAVAAMGGQVELDSEVNRGTTVRCVFPVREGKASGNGTTPTADRPTGVEAA
jgi:two-component system phosphate regulon sensor histidine kinase PhoR